MTDQRSRSYSHGIRYDHIAETLGAPAEPFEEQHQNQVTEMKRLVLLYVKGLQDMLNPGSHVDLTESAPTTKFEMESGFPKLPPSLNYSGWSKKQLEVLMRSYLSHHYSRSVYHCQMVAHSRC